VRVRLTFSVAPPASLDLNYNHAQQGLVYALLGMGDAEFARFLHDEGFGPAGRRFKAFCFSPIRSPGSRVVGSRLVLTASMLQFDVASPVRRLAEALMAVPRGLRARLGPLRLTLKDVRPVPLCDFTEGTVTALARSAWVVSVPVGRGGTKYLVPGEDPVEVIASALTRSVLERVRGLMAAAVPLDVPIDPARLRFSVTLDRGYLSRRAAAGRPVTRLISVRSDDGAVVKVRGVVCPLMLCGSVEMLRLAFDLGVGEKTSLGFGFIEPSTRCGRPAC